MLLTDGTDIAIRPIRPEDKAQLEAGLHRLSSESVYARFMSAKPHFSAAELRYLTEVDGRDHVALVAAPADRDGFIVAVARYVRDPRDPATAEAAVLVADPLQRKGLGRALGLALADEARANGITRFTASMLGTNVAAHRLMHALTERVAGGGVEHGVREVSADLAA